MICQLAAASPTPNHTSPKKRKGKRKRLQFPSFFLRKRKVTWQWQCWKLIEKNPSIPRERESEGPLVLVPKSSSPSSVNLRRFPQIHFTSSSIQLASLLRHSSTIPKFSRFPPCFARIVNFRQLPTGLIHINKSSVFNFSWRVLKTNVWSF